jgi:hypothetical protein
MDTHSYTTEICVKTRANTPGRTWQVSTNIPALREAIAAKIQSKSFAALCAARLDIADSGLRVQRDDEEQAGK